MYFNQVAESGMYLMPQYTSSLILASDVKVFFPGLGAWNDTDDDDNINGAIHILMEYAYAPNLEGGFGPFTFAPADDTHTNPHNFRVERKNGGILLTVPGAQIIGYITKVVPKFPHNQNDPPAPILCTAQPVKQQKRRRRSVSGDINNTPSIKNLAESLFLDSFERSSKHVPTSTTLEFLPEKDAISNEVLDQLIQESDATKERIEKFIETLEYNDTPSVAQQQKKKI